MNTKKILSILAVGALFFTACTKKLEQTDPQTLPIDIALGTDANVKKVLIGGYDAMSSGNLYGGNIQLFADLLGANGEIQWVGTFNTYREIFNKNMLTTNPNVTGVWVAGYNAINIANNVLTALTVVNAADQNRVKGEALTIRAAMHFEMLRLFAKDYRDGTPASNPGIPIMLVPTNTVGEITYPARSSVNDVYTQIITDLVEAEGLVPAKNGVYFNKATVSGMLARVYLQMGRWADARDAANRGIATATSNGFGLLTDFTAIFNSGVNTPEDLFTIQVSDQDGGNNLHLFYSIPEFGARDGDIEINDKHLDMYELDDLRFYFYLGLGAPRTAKHFDIYKNVKVMRLAELYLIRAEANLRAGTSVGATPLADLNRIRTRAGMLPLGAATLDQIYLDRHLELAFEGHAIHDIRRFGKTVDGLTTVDGKAINDSRIVFPIPQREINVNKTLTQNQGY